MPLARSKGGKGAGLDCGVVARGMVVWSVVVWGLGGPFPLAGDLPSACSRSFAGGSGEGDRHERWELLGVCR
jgi:hypothetical protein